jgi:hypothetical protein
MTSPAARASDRDFGVDMRPSLNQWLAFSDTVKATSHDVFGSKAARPYSGDEVHNVQSIEIQLPLQIWIANLQLQHRFNFRASV